MELLLKAFDARYPEFASDPPSVRLGLASDGFNPFCTVSTLYSTWPVVLIPYNLPPWICMKQQSFILLAIISGEKGPGNDIDINLQPLIQELKLLWEGVDAYDAFSKQHFKLRASLLWTVNDFPAYANLSGWSTKGHVACPTCSNSTCSRYFEGVETRFDRLPRNAANILREEMYMLNSDGCKLGKVDINQLDNKSLVRVHRYVLLNHSKIQPFRYRFLGEQQATKDKPLDSKTIEKLLVEKFAHWFQGQVPFLEENKFDEEVISLAIGRSTFAKQYKGFITNGFRFLTRRREESKKTQISESLWKLKEDFTMANLSTLLS